MLGENYLNNSYRAHRTNWAFLLTVVFGVVVTGVFIYYYIQTTNIISQRNLTIATQQAESVSLNSQITSLGNGLTTASSTIASLQGQLSSTQSQLTSANAQILSLGNDLSAGKSQIANLQSQASSYQNQASSYQNQASSYQNQVATLQSQNNELQNIVNLAAYAAQVSSVPISQAAGQMSPVTSFTANYAGYIVVSGSSSSGSGYVRVTDTYSSYPYNSYNYPFSTSGSVLVPVLPGTITVYYGNNDAAAVTATISVMYYY